MFSTNKTVKHNCLLRGHMIVLYLSTQRDVYSWSVVYLRKLSDQINTLTHSQMILEHLATSWRLQELPEITCFQTFERCAVS